MALDISHESLILIFQVAQLVLEPGYLSLVQVLPLNGTLLQDLILRPKLHILARLLILGELELVDSGVERLQLLSAQELLLLFWEGSQPLNLLRLDLTHVLQRLILAQQHINLLLVLGVLVSYLRTGFLSLDQLVFYLLNRLFVLLTDIFELGLVRRFELSSHLLVALCSLCNDFLELDDQMLALLELRLVLLFFGQE